eukprot:Skav225010  [mRNA]  locus=scaffold957:154601:155972:+ [translate_table: standard]
MSAELQQWATGVGRFLKPGETDVEIQLKGRQKLTTVKVSNISKAKVWVCGFCGETVLPRNIGKHLAKPCTGRRGSGCAEVTLAALRELMCFCDPEDAQLAEQKVAEIEAPKGNGSPAIASVASPAKESKAKGKRSQEEEPKGSPKRARAKAATETPKARESPAKRGKSVEKKKEKEEKEEKEKPEKISKTSKTTDSKDKKRKEEKSENRSEKKRKDKPKESEDLPPFEAPKERKKRKEAVTPSTPRTPTSPAKKGRKKPATHSTPQVDVEAEAVQSATDDDEKEEVLDSTFLGIDGVDESELPNIPEAALVASADLVAQTVSVNWEGLDSDELTQDVALEGDQSEFLSKRIKDGPSWSGIISGAADAKLELRWDSATISASTSKSRMTAALQLG